MFTSSVADINSIRFVAFTHILKLVRKIVFLKLFTSLQKSIIAFFKKIVAISSWCSGPIRVESFINGLELVDQVSFSCCQDEVISVDSFYSIYQHVSMIVAFKDNHLIVYNCIYRTYFSLYSSKLSVIAIISFSHKF